MTTLDSLKQRVKAFDEAAKNGSITFPTPTAPTETTTQTTERERLREIDCRVERARGRSLTDVYPDSKSGRIEWYWTGRDERGNRKPKIVPYYTSSPQDSLALLRELILLEGEIQIGGYPGPNTTDEECWIYGKSFLCEKMRHSLKVTIALAYIRAKTKRGE